MAYIDFPNGLEGQKKRKEFFLSEEGLILISGWRRQGVPLTKIAEDYIGISKTAFWGWYRKSEELRKACAVSQDICNSNVEKSLYQRAMGYDRFEDTYELVEGEMTLTKRFRRHVPADTKAILAWLYNRMPNRWRSLQEPLEATQYKDTIKDILVAMKEVADKGGEKQIEVKENNVTYVLEDD